MTGTARLRRLAALVLLPLLLAGTPLQAEEAYWIYTVRPGDTIWDLSERYTTSVLNWKRLQRINGIPDGVDRRVPPGTRLKFPLSLLKRQPAQAELARLSGQARILRADGRSEPAAEGQRLGSGDRLVTEAGASVLIRFADDSELLVLESSEVQMDSLGAWGETGMVDTRMRLQGGQVDTHVTPARGPGSRYEITTPAAVAAVRGTAFRVSAGEGEDGKARMRSEVLEGVVGVAGAGASQRVPAGYGLVAQAGEPPAPPRPLLPAPDLGDMDTRLRQLPLAFTWAPVQGAVGYRFQIAPDAHFDRLLADGRVPGTRAWWEDLPDGRYVLRVRAIDDAGLEGLNAVQAFEVDARPFAPALVGLIGDVLIRDPRPEFGWTEPGGAARYRLQLARDEALSDLLIDRDDLVGRSYRPDAPLTPGHYYWRMASITADGEQGPFSDVQHFEFRSVPDTPAVERPAIGEHELAFRWQSAGPGMRYDFELADTPDFSEPLVSRRTDEPEIRLPRPASQAYWFRVRAVDETGYAGPWAPSQRIEVPPNGYWPLLIPLGMLLLL